MLVIKSYSIPHQYPVEQFIQDYSWMLTKILDNIWNQILWSHKPQIKQYRISDGKFRQYQVSRLIPIIPKSREFKRELRNLYRSQWSYAAHYVDSAIRTAYSVLRSWRSRYLRGDISRAKPVMKRRFVRIKSTLYSYRNGKLRITITPGEYLEFDLTKQWFWDRIKDCSLGELILKPDRLIITVKANRQLKLHSPIAWDLNLLSMDGYDGSGFTKINLKPIYTIHREYELKRAKIQRIASKAPKTAWELMAKYSAKERNRVHDLLHKLSKQLAKRSNIFEDLNRLKLRINSRSRSLNRQNQRHDYITLQKYIQYKSEWNGYATLFVSAINSSRTCSRCGYLVKTRNRSRLFSCPRCGLVIDRHTNAALNLWNRFLGMWGAGFPPKGSKSNEGLDEPLDSSKDDELQGKYAN